MTPLLLLLLLFVRTFDGVQFVNSGVIGFERRGNIRVCGRDEATLPHVGELRWIVCIGAALAGRVTGSSADSVPQLFFAIGNYFRYTGEIMEKSIGDKGEQQRLHPTAFRS